MMKIRHGISESTQKVCDIQNCLTYPRPFFFFFFSLSLASLVDPASSCVSLLLCAIVVCHLSLLSSPLSHIQSGPLPVPTLRLCFACQALTSNLDAGAPRHELDCSGWEHGQQEGPLPARGGTAGCHDSGRCRGSEAAPAARRKPKCGKP